MGLIMKPHYNDALQAAWMAREHKVKLKSPRGQSLYYDDGDSFRTEKDCGIYAGGRYIISDDSLHIFEPQEGDIVNVTDDENRDITGIMAMYNQIFHHDGILLATQYDTARIIQRQGKAFFMPIESGEANG